MNRKIVEVTATKIYCHRPHGLRVGVGIIALLFASVCFWLLVALWPSPASLADRSPADILSHLVPTLLVPLLGLCFPTLLFLYFAGPADLILDTDQHTYRFRRGFPLLAAWQSGTFEDIAGLRVNALRGKSSSSSSSFQMLLDWNNAQASPWTIGDGAVASRGSFQMDVSRDASQVQQEVQKIAQQMGVPVQERKPVLEQARRRTQRQLVLVPLILFFLLFGLPPFLVSRSLESEGQTTRGTVTQMHHGKGYSVQYRYAAGGQTFQGSAPVPWSVYEGLDVGSTVPVRYLPAYPHTSTVVGSRSSPVGVTILIYGSLLVVLLLATTFARSKQDTIQKSNG